MIIKREETMSMENGTLLHTHDDIVPVEELKTAISKMLQEVDLNQKKKDFAHLLFNENNAERILHFQEIVNSSLG